MFIIEVLCTNEPWKKISNRNDRNLLRLKECFRIVFKKEKKKRKKKKLGSFCTSFTLELSPIKASGMCYHDCQDKTDSLYSFEEVYHHQPER